MSEPATVPLAAVRAAIRECDCDERKGGMALTDTDYLEVHLIVEKLANDPGDRRLREAAWKLVHRLRDQGKIPSEGSAPRRQVDE
jgi:hypothetical protein